MKKYYSIFYILGRIFSWFLCHLIRKYKVLWQNWTYKLLRLGVNSHKLSGTLSRPHRSILRISREDVPFKWGNVRFETADKINFFKWCKWENPSGWMAWMGLSFTWRITIRGRIRWKGTPIWIIRLLAKVLLNVKN